MTKVQHANENLTIHVKVKDYSTWRTSYDEHEKSRLSAGIQMGECSATPMIRMIL